MENQLTSDNLLYEVRDGIGHVVFNRPAARNAFTVDMYFALADICAATQPTVRCAPW